MTIVGYGRVSTADQSTDLQMDALRAAGCTKIFEEHASGAAVDRPVLAECLRYLQPGDTLVVWKLDRLGRSLSHLLSVVDELRRRGVEFKSCMDSIDTKTPAGRAMFQMMGVFAEFERAVIQERVVAGLASARARGRVGGRRVKHDAETRAEIASIAKVVGPVAAAAQFGLSRPTVARYCAEHG